MWDYQVGLVRITPFFKALKWTKVSQPIAILASAYSQHTDIR